MILLDYWPLDRLQSDKRKLSEVKIAGIIPLWQLKEKIPFFILSIVLVIITLYTPNNTPNNTPDTPLDTLSYTPLDTPDMSDFSSFKQFPLISRMVNAPVAFVTYLGKTFWPHDMAIFYPFSDQIPLWQVIVASLLILVISVAVIVIMKRLPYLFTGWLWFSITIAPVIGIIQISISTPYAMADRYHYLPSIGLAVMMAWGIPALIKSEEIRKKILFPAGIIFLVIISFLSWNQCGYWKHSVTLLSHTLRVTKNNYWAYSRLGNAYGKLGQYQSALENFNEVIRLKPNYFIAYNGRGICYSRLGMFQMAIENFNKAISLKQDYAAAYYNRALVYLNQGDNISGCRDAQKVCKLGNCKFLEDAKQRGVCR
jgi:lipoprotein NlpI